MAMLEVRNLEVYYGVIQALKGISFDVEQGEIVALIGANGAGKTTTLHTITGLLSAKAGTISYQGTDITRVPGYKLVKMGIAHVPEGRRVFSNLTVLQNLKMGAYTRSDKGEIEETLKLAQMKLDNRPTLVVYQGGEVENLPLEDILFLEQQGRQVCIVTRNGGTTTIYGKLSDLLPQLEGAPFVQTHKSYCVHLAQVVKVDEALRCFVMAGGKNVPIRRLLMGKAKRAWVDFLFAQTRGER